MPKLSRSARLLNTPHSLFSASAMLIVLVIAVGMGLTYHVFTEQVQRPRIERVASSVSAYIQAVRQFAGVATPAQIERFIHTLTTDSSVRLVDRRQAQFNSPRGPLLPEFLSQVQAAASDGGFIAWHDGGGVDQAIWFEVNLSNGQSIWLSYPAQVNPISPLAVAGLFGLFFALAIGAAALLQARLQPPLRALGEAVERLARGERDVDLPLTGDRELTELAMRVNQMARELANSEQDRALLLAGISHDLRTPLTRIRLALAVRDDHPGDESVIRAIDEIDNIIGQFVEFARAGTDAEPLLHLSLNDLISEVAASYELDGTPFALDLQPLPLARVRPVAMQRILTNLMGNAAHYAGVGLTVSTRFEAGMLCMRINDAGPGVTSAELASLGRPFMRTAMGRAKKPGSGLGLAIVHRLLGDDGGTLTLETNAQGGLTAVVRVPPAIPAHCT